MEILSLLGQGFVVASTPLNIALLLMGCFIGTLLGALPGLGPVNGVAVLIPLTFTFGFDATSSMILLCAVYFGCMYGGRISSILLNIPGDEPAIMTTLDGYPMAVQGQAANALAISGVASFVGSTIAVIGLSLFRTHPRARSDPFRPGRLLRPLYPRLRHHRRHRGRRPAQDPALGTDRPDAGDRGPRPDLGRAALHLRQFPPL